MKTACWVAVLVVLSASSGSAWGGDAASQPVPGVRTGFGAVNYVVLGAYLAAMVLLGAYFSRREKTAEDFFLAGRRAPWWAAGLSIFGGGLSALTYMAIPGTAYEGDWVRLFAYAVPVALIPVVVGIYIPFYRRLRVATAYEYLERRFSLSVRWFASGYFVLFQVGRMAIMLYLPAVALSTVTGMNLYLCIALMGVLATVYTVLGGIEAVIWTDVVQVIVLTVGAAVMLWTIAAKIPGGLGEIVTAGAAHGKFHTFNWTWDYTAAAVWVMVVGSLLTALSPNTADQSVVQRYLATRDERGAGRAAWASALLGIPTGFCFLFLGTALFVFYRVHYPQFLDPKVQRDAIVPFFIMQQLPAGVSGLVIAGIFAAAMSTVDNGMNAIASAVTTDFYRRLRPAAGERRLLLLARWVTLAAGGIATAAALGIGALAIESQFDFFWRLLGLFGGTLAGLFVLAIFTRRAGGVGALVGAVASAAAVVSVRTWTKAHGMLYAPVGLGVCVGIGYVVSLLLPGRRKRLDGLTVYTMPPRLDD